MAEKNKHTLLKVVGAAAAAGAAAYGGFAYYVFRNAFDLQHSALFARKNTERLSDSEKSQWFAHSVRDDEFLNSYDGLKLHALRLMNHPESHKWILLVHGFGCTSADLINHMYEADHRDYNILAIDARGCGMSEGRYTGLGWNEHYDVISWINYLVTLDTECEIVLFGMNAGGAAIINAVGDYLPSNVKCAIEDGAFSEIRDVIKHGVRHFCKVEGKPFMPAVDTLVKQFLHFSMNDVSMKHQLKNASVPMLFIHGTEDEVVPTSMLFDNYYACASEKELFTAEGKGFNEAETDPAYFTTVFEFAEKYVN